MDAVTITEQTSQNKHHPSKSWHIIAIASQSGIYHHKALSEWSCFTKGVESHDSRICQTSQGSSARCFISSGRNLEKGFSKLLEHSLFVRASPSPEDLVANPVDSIPGCHRYHA
jgi:hypothetical protein